MITEQNNAIEGFEPKTSSVISGSDALSAGGEIQIDLKDDYEEITKLERPAGPMRRPSCPLERLESLMDTT